MNDPDMLSEVPRLGKPPPTLLTPIGHLSRVGEPMNPSCRHVCESHPTELALVSLLTGVNPLVRVPIPSGGKTLSTVTAPKGLFARVGSSMSIKLVVCSEILAAKFALGGFFSRVQTLVAFELTVALVVGFTVPALKGATGHVKEEVALK